MSPGDSAPRTRATWRMDSFQNSSCQALGQNRSPVRRSVVSFAPVASIQSRAAPANVRSALEAGAIRDLVRGHGGASDERSGDESDEQRREAARNEHREREHHGRADRVERLERALREHVAEPLERDHRRRVRRRRRRRDPIEREKERRRGDRDRDDRRRGLRARQAPCEPDREGDEHGRRDGQELPLGDVVDEPRRERADLDHRHGEVGDGGGHERSRADVGLPALERMPGEDAERDERDGDRQQRQRADVPGDGARDVADRVRARLAERRIRAEQLADAAQCDPRARSRRAARAPRAASVGHIRRTGVVERSKAASRPSARRITATKPDRLQPRREREPDRAEQERLPRERRLPEAPRERPDGKRRDRVVERLAHEQAAVHEPGDQDRQSGRDERPAGTGERTRPEEDGDGGQRHEERLEQLDAGHAGGEVAADERDADDERVDEAVVRDRLAEHLEPVSRDERAPKEAVELLVRRDPGCGDVAREREADGRRRDDEDGEPGDGAIETAASSHRGSLPVPEDARSGNLRSRRRARRLDCPDPLTRSSEAGKETMTTQHPQSPGREAGPLDEDRAPTPVLDADAISKSLSRIAHELIERATGPDRDGLEQVALVGIQTRGVPLASRLRRLVAERSGAELELGALDITFHRDDVHVRDGGRPPGRQPVVRATSIPFSLEGKTVVLVDDVLYTGRTIRAAIDALLEFGRPARVQLAVLVDRGHRELPIRPDYVGKNLPTARTERIQVELVEVDEVDRVLLLRETEDSDV